MKTVLNHAQLTEVIGPVREQRHRRVDLDVDDLGRLYFETSHTDIIRDFGKMMSDIKDALGVFGPNAFEKDNWGCRYTLVAPNRLSYRQFVDVVSRYFGDYLDDDTNLTFEVDLNRLRAA